ncbi:hypothetical protein DB313_02235 [Borrelia turcica IST7]|uniref:Uncharacterized protein n=1 Tax=Borrelia turcica IST7 TaxID=1104446 RepID=A0A386PMS1_9SPIR|nr:hypothetical protein [Borrelia turcica]AYE36299.1 hypothetical protein DB313_02235 [Borrelia turcica IST7]
MFKLIRKIFIVYFLCITLAGLVMVFFDSKFSEKESVQNGKSQIIKHKIDPNLLLFTSSIGGFLGVYAGIWIFDYEKNNFYLSWGSLIILIYNIGLILFVYSKSTNK